MSKNGGLKFRNRMETRKHQREAKQHFHPRGLARAVVHNRMAQEEMFGVNKVHPGTDQSAFAKNWRNFGEKLFG